MKAGVWWCARDRLAPQTSHPLPRITSLGLRRNKEERFEASNVSGPVSPLLTHWCDYTLPFGSMAMVLLAAIWRHSWYCWLAAVSSSSVAGLLTANMKGGIARSDIGCCWVAVALAASAISSLILFCGVLPKWLRRPPDSILWYSVA